MAERRTEYMRLSEILPADRNAKRHDKAAIKASIAEHGVIDTAVLDERTGKLIGGHGRLEGIGTLQQAGDEPPDGVTVADDGEWLVPIQRGWSSKDDADADAAAVKLNQLTIAGGWDDRILAEILGEQAAVAGDNAAAAIALLGFDQAQYDKLLASAAPPQAPDAFPDAEAIAGHTQHQCPKCGYAWSGSPTPNAPKA